MKNEITRSIVIPAYSEEKFIGQTLVSLYEYLNSRAMLKDTEVIVVTADAEDKTQEIVREKIKVFPLHQHVQPGPRVGKGRDVKAGLKVANGKYVLFMDADLATPLSYVDEAFKILETTGGMVIGTRLINKMHNNFTRRFSSLIANTVVRCSIGLNISDSQCGFKAFDRGAIEVILPRSEITGWGFDFEFIKIAKIHRIKITSLMIPDWKDPKPEGEGLSGDSQLNAMKKTLKELLTVKKKQLAGEYK